jgi:uncharacterized protein YbjT (DUF2867 family)
VTTAVIGATGRVGSEIVRGVLARGDAVAALVRDPAKARRAFGELGEPVTFQVAAERQFLEHLTGAGVPAGTAELLITREWAILAGENDYTTGTFQQITGHPPRPVAEFLHDYRAEFL